MCVTCFLIVFTEAFIQVLAGAISACIIVRVLLSWMPARLPLGLGELVYGVSEPILAPIRRALPLMGGFDLSPFIALLLINYVIEPLLLAALPPPV